MVDVPPLATLDALEHRALGSPTAPVTLVEFGDFECPYCREAAPVVRELVETSDGGVQLVFRHFPLFEVHPFALTAALAAEVAASQGAFWPMHDLLFDHQDRLSDSDLRGYAESLGIDGASVVGAAAQAVGATVELDYADGLAAGVDGTPSLFLDGVRFRGRITVARLRDQVAELLEADQRAPWARR